MFGFSREEVFQPRTDPHYLEISHPNTENDLPNKVAVDGKVLHTFFTTISRVRWRQDARERQVRAQPDDDFQLEAVGYGLSEVGAILVGRITHGQDISRVEIEVIDYSELESTLRIIKDVGRLDVDNVGLSVSSFDIQRALERGEVCGWIHAQPGNTLPSDSLEKPSDVSVSRLIAQQADCPIHLALITDRGGKRITGYLYDDQARNFQKLRSLMIGISPKTSAARRERLKEISYTDR